MPLPRHARYGGILCASLAGCYLSDDYSGGLPPESGDPGGASTTQGGAAGQTTRSGAGGVSGFPSTAGKGGAVSAGKGGTSAGGKGGAPPGAGQGGTVSAGTGGKNTAGSPGQGGSGAGGMPAMQSPCAQLAAVHCQRLATECAIAYEAMDTQGMQPCQQRTTEHCEAVRALPGVPSDISLCAQRIASGQAARGCEGRYDPFYACRLPGAFSDGASCVNAAQCQGGYCLNLFGCSTCATWVGQGESCKDPSTTICAPELFCQDGVCVPRQATGEACAYATDCQPGLSCSDQVCQPPLPVGASCTTLGQCNEAQGESCANGHCQSPAQASPGGPCGQLEQYTFCPNGQACQILLFNLSGTCVPFVPDGGACNPTTPTCQPPATCDQGVCRLVPSCTM